MPRARRASGYRGIGGGGSAAGDRSTGWFTPSQLDAVAAAVKRSDAAFEHTGTVTLNGSEITFAMDANAGGNSYGARYGLRYEWSITDSDASGAGGGDGLGMLNGSGKLKHGLLLAELEVDDADLKLNAGQDQSFGIFLGDSSATEVFTRYISPGVSLRTDANYFLLNRHDASGQVYASSTWARTGPGRLQLRLGIVIGGRTGPNPDSGVGNNNLIAGHASVVRTDGADTYIGGATETPRSGAFEAANVGFGIFVANTAFATAGAYDLAMNARFKFESYEP